MKKIVLINSLPVGSTGSICRNLKKFATESGMQAFFLCGNWKYTYNGSDSVKFGYKIDNYVSTVLYRLTGLANSFNYFSTKKLLKELDKIKPDVIHIHNIHLNCLNISKLFEYIKKNHISVVWTFHDCWPFTGRCPHFTISGCDKWKHGCKSCSYSRKMYPQTFFNRTGKMWKLKRDCFTGVEKMVIATPSRWLSNIAKQSFFGKYPIEVINNGIDLNVFKPSSSDIFCRMGIKAKYVLLGVAFDWGYRKGLDVFVELAKRLNDDYKIVLVGTNDSIDKSIPKEIVTVHRTNSVKDMVELYSSSTLFINPTREETYPTVNMEALACGCPVITFNTGGSPEIIDEKTGSVVPYNDIDKMETEIIEACCNAKFDRNACVARAQSFDLKERFKKYIDLYSKI